VVIKREEDSASPQLTVVCPLPLKNVSPSVRNFDFKPILNDKMVGEDKKMMMMDIEDYKDFPSISSTKPSESNKVSVVLTLSTSAGENIGGVIAAIADLLRIAVPPSYEISRSPSPDSAHRIGYTARVKHKEEAINIQSLMMTRSKYCFNCDAVILSSADIIKKKNKLSSSLLDDQYDWDDSDELIFCSTSCSDQFDSTGFHKTPPTCTTSLDNIPPLLPTPNDSTPHPMPEDTTESKHDTGTDLSAPAVIQEGVKNEEQGEKEDEEKKDVAVVLVSSPQPGASSPVSDASAVLQTTPVKGSKAGSRLKHKIALDQSKVDLVSLITFILCILLCIYYFCLDKTVKGYESSTL